MVSRRLGLTSVYSEKETWRLENPLDVGTFQRWRFAFKKPRKSISGTSPVQRTRCRVGISETGVDFGAC